MFNNIQNRLSKAVSQSKDAVATLQSTIKERATSSPILNLGNDSKTPETRVSNDLLVFDDTPSNIPDKQQHNLQEQGLLIDMNPSQTVQFESVPLSPLQQSDPNNQELLAIISQFVPINTKQDLDALKEYFKSSKSLEKQLKEQKELAQLEADAKRDIFESFQAKIQEKEEEINRLKRASTSEKEGVFREKVKELAAALQKANDSKAESSLKVQELEKLVQSIPKLETELSTATDKIKVLEVECNKKTRSSTEAREKEAALTSRITVLQSKLEAFEANAVATTTTSTEDSDAVAASHLKESVNQLKMQVLSDTSETDPVIIVMQLIDKYDSLNSTIDTLRANLAKAENGESEEMKKRIAKLNENLLSNNFERSEADATIEQLKSQMDEKQAAIDLLTSSNQVISAELKEVEIKLQQLKDLEIQVEQLKDVELKLQADLRDKDATLTATQQELDHVQLTFQQDDSSKQLIMNEFQTQIEQLIASETSLKQKINELNRENSESQQTSQLLQISNETLKSKLREVSDLLEMNEGALQAKTSELQAANSQLQDQINRNSVIQEQLNMNSSQFQSFETAAKLSNEELETSKRLFQQKSIENDQLKSRVAELERSLFEVQSRLDENIGIQEKLEAEMSKLKGASVDFSNEKEQLNSELIECRAQMAEFEIKIEQSLMEIEQHKRQYQESKSKNISVSAELDTFKVKYNEMVAKLKEDEDLIADSEQKFQQELQDKISEIEQVKMREVQLKNLNRALKEEVRKLSRTGSTTVSSPMSPEPPKTRETPVASPLKQSTSQEITPESSLYLKNVFLKFLESRDKRKTLINVIATLLEFSPEELNKAKKSI